MEHSLGKILIVDDEEDIVELMEYNLQDAGYTTLTAFNGDDAIRKAAQFVPDLILLDVMMPEKDGFQTIKAIRNNPQLDHTIVIFLTALSDEKSEIEGLKLGADDYIYKPLKPDLIIQRVRTALRRKRKHADEESENTMQFGDLEINRYKFTVNYQGVEIILAKKEFELLCLLASKPGRVFLRNEILDNVWGSDIIVGDRTIDVHIRKIRLKTGVDMIKTVKGMGYKFEFE
jgi:two-component system alkaline phosphatase synthesis response regulator PhoP